MPGARSASTPTHPDVADCQGREDGDGGRRVLADGGVGGGDDGPVVEQTSLHRTLDPATHASQSRQQEGEDD